MEFRCEKLEIVLGTNIYLRVKKCIIFNVFKIVKTIDHPRKEISNETKGSNQIFLIFDFEEGRKKNRLEATTFIKFTANRLVITVRNLTYLI